MPLDPKRDKPKPGKRSPVGRKSGRPKVQDRPIGPAEHLIIARGVLRNVPLIDLAVQLGVSEATIRFHLEHNIRPIWHHGMQRTAELELAKIDEVERTAWECFAKTLDNETHETIKQELEKEGGNLKTVERMLKTVTTAGSTAWMHVVMNCIAERAKILGYYAAQRFKIDGGGSIRVAGKSREDINKELLQRIAHVVKNKEVREQMLQGFGTQQQAYGVQN